MVEQHRIEQLAVGIVLDPTRIERLDRDGAAAVVQGLGDADELKDAQAARGRPGQGVGKDIGNHAGLSPIAAAYETALFRALI